MQIPIEYSMLDALCSLCKSHTINHSSNTSAIDIETETETETETKTETVAWDTVRENPLEMWKRCAFGVLPIRNMYVFIGIYRSLDESIYVNSIQMLNVKWNCQLTFEWRVEYSRMWTSNFDELYERSAKYNITMRAYHTCQWMLDRHELWAKVQGARYHHLKSAQIAFTWHSLKHVCIFHFHFHFSFQRWIRILVLHLVKLLSILTSYNRFSFPNKTLFVGKRSQFLVVTLCLFSRFKWTVYHC